MIAQADVWWADLQVPRGSEPGFRRPMVVIQGDALNRGRLPTTVCVALTSNLNWAAAPGNAQRRLRQLARDAHAELPQRGHHDPGVFAFQGVLDAGLPPGQRRQQQGAVGQALGPGQGHGSFDAPDGL